MNVLVDLNVLLDVFLNRAPWLADSAAVLAANHAGRITVHVSAIAVRLGQNLSPNPSPKRGGEPEGLFVVPALAGLRPRTA